jgi:hypothetical protein
MLGKSPSRHLVVNFENSWDSVTGIATVQELYQLTDVKQISKTRSRTNCEQPGTLASKRKQDNSLRIDDDDPEVRIAISDDSSSKKQSKSWVSDDGTL